MKNSECLPREVLRSVQRFVGSTIFIAPSSIGPFDKADLEALLQDVHLLTRLGARVFLVQYERTHFWEGLELPSGMQCVVDVSGSVELVSCAATYSATKLFLLSGTDRIASLGQRLSDVSVAEATHLLSSGRIVTPEARETLRVAVAACEAGIPRVHIINVHRDGAFLNELCTDYGAGTMIHTDQNRKEVHVMRQEERFGVTTLLRDIVPHRTNEFVREHGRELHVFVIDSDVYGVARLTAHEKTLVVRALAYSPSADTTETLSFLLRAALSEAKERGLARVVLPADELPALMRILPWFKDLGFAKGKYSLGGANLEVWLKDVA
jgi:N-acetylglutamate synthase-like GNAT family acetyltransferase